MEIDLNRFRDLFFQETEEHLGTMESTLLALLETPGDSELLNAVFRAAHSIKGASGTFGYDLVSGFTHIMENLLDRMRSGAVEVSRERLELVLDSLDRLKALIEAAQTGSEAPEDVGELNKWLTIAQRDGDFSRGKRAQLRKDDGAIPVVTIRFKPSPDLLRQAMEPALLLNSLSECGEIRQIAADWSELPPLAEMDPEACYLGWNIQLATVRREEEVRDAFAFVEDGADLSIQMPLRPVRQSGDAPRTGQPGEPVHAKGPAREGTIRVDTGKVDKLIDLVGELVIAQSMAAQILAGFSMDRLLALEAAFSDIERYTRELQERVMGIRMVPIGTVFSRFPRLVHDLSASTGKRIVLEVSGEDTELDKTVVESMSDPLMHLIRNAADHGLESPGDRVSAGKPEEGTIGLRAFHEGGSVLVEISDDGRGLDVDKIRRKALERGLIRSSDELTGAEVQALIFEPGFSTAETVTDLSGRGVGMDVVKRNVEALNGSIGVATEPGRGTTVRIKLPLTLAILDGLLVRVGAEIYVLPLIAIVESMRPACKQLNVIAGRGEVVLVRGDSIPLVRLHEMLNIPGAVTSPNEGLLVIVENQGARLALLVDELLGQQQVVIKTLETNFRKVDGVVGATILGDGRAALILDVAGLAQMRRSETRAVALCA